MKITFINFGRENLGIEYLSAILKNAGFETALLNDPGLFTKEDNVFCSRLLEKIFSRKKRIIEEIVQTKPDLAAFSVYTSNYIWACEVAREIKKRLDTKIVFGGVHPTLVPQEVIKQETVDFVIRGEGEAAFLVLVRALKDNARLENVPSLFYKKNGRIIENKLSPPLENLDALPLPDKELFARDVCFRDDYMITTSRGCFYNCSYCCESFYNKLYKNQYFRRRSVDSVMKELTVMKEKYNFQEVMFFDSILFTDKKWLKGLVKRFRREIDVPFRCTGHVRFLDEEIARLLKDGGCYCIDFGIQTFSERVRREILNRHETNFHIQEALDICDRFKLKYDLDLMFGLPEVQEEDYLLAVKFLQRNKYLSRIKCYNLVYYPKLLILDKAKELGLLSPDDAADIENGRINDWFRQDIIKDPKHKLWKDNFQRLYKLYPLIPHFARRFIIKYKLYRQFRLIPGFLIVFMQLVNGILKGDYRFSIYIRNYFYHFKKRLFENRKIHKIILVTENTKAIQKTITNDKK
ncbi:MAG: radical SAM protein [Candidatus Omnitrophota bacterium]